MGVENLKVGGWKGYWVPQLILILNTPPSYGEPFGPGTLANKFE